jgi:hypothetical protein
MARYALDHGRQRLARGMLQQGERDSAADERRDDECGGTGPAPAPTWPVMRGGGVRNLGILVGVKRAASGADGLGPGRGDPGGPAKTPLGPPGDRAG